MTVLHQIDPIALDLGTWNLPLLGSVHPQIHWYGIMYLLAFVAAWWLGQRRVRAGRLPGVDAQAYGDLIFYGALGVMLGGRLGYISTSSFFRAGYGEKLRLLLSEYTDIEAVIVPVSIVYEQLHEVGLMTAEARGGRKRPEDVRWLVNFARQQTRRLGRAYLDFGEPLPLRERLAELRAEDPTGRNLVERVALDTSHRINRATPVTVTAVVCLAMLAADLVFGDEVVEHYVHTAEWEQKEYDRRITDWELQRGFERY